MYKLVLILNAAVVYCQPSPGYPVSYTQALRPTLPTINIVENCKGFWPERVIPLASFATYGECMERVAVIGESRRERAICRKEGS